MSGGTDAYRQWDAAYLLGALDPAERREYEDHLTGCPDCAAEVAGLRAVTDVLSVVQADRATALLGPAPTAASGPPDLLPRLAAATGRLRRRARLGAVALAAAAAAVAAVLAWSLPRSISDEPPKSADRTVVLAEIGPPRPLSAQARLIAEPWGTRIEAACQYDATPATPGGPTPRPYEYTLYVTDTAGQSVKVASWLASPGTEARPYATTTLPLDRIAVIDIRSARTGAVVLRADL